MILAPASVPRIGTAGWSIASQHKPVFSDAGSHLQRYAGRLNAVEINSSFYRPHRRATYERWAASVPAEFRFAVKMPKTVTHEARLRGCTALVAEFLAAAEGLGKAFEPLLVQLPPTLAFERAVAEGFFRMLRDRHGRALCCEPRHASWFGDEATVLFQDLHIARVAADPPPVPEADRLAGWPGLVYRRLHGAPRLYYSNYDAEALSALVAQIREDYATGAEVWCVFDNTAEGHALGNAITVADQCAAVGNNSR